jgi:EAL domain-containing protein (putative c-di-GMP-specific phosphodiesterase class I)
VALTPVGDPAILLRHAEIAMARAKEDGRDRTVLFDEELRDVTTDRLGLLADLRHAVARGELRLHYQPIVALDGQRVEGVEALVRWEHPQRGLVPPDEFISLAENRGLIVDIGRWVLREACRQAALWVNAGPDGKPLHMAVNVSALQLASGAGLVDSVAAVLRDSGVDPSVLVLEITETALMGNPEAALEILTRLKALGVNLAIDDFGTGYSSLAHLQQFPVDALKIDRSFISGLEHNKEGETLIRTLVQLGKALSIETFAEGIEQQQELSLLRDEDCDNGQGFLFARPLDVVGTEAFFRETAKPAAAALAPQHT